MGLSIKTLMCFAPYTTTENCTLLEEPEITCTCLYTILLRIAVMQHVFAQASVAKFKETHFNFTLTASKNLFDTACGQTIM